MRKLALHWKIIIGMVAGVLYGLVAAQMGWVDFTNHWIKPWGVIFINLLKLIAVPLVFASLIKGVSSLSDISKLSRIGGKTIGIYLMSTIIAVTFGLLLVNVVQPGKSFSEEKEKSLRNNTLPKQERKLPLQKMSRKKVRCSLWWTLFRAILFRLRETTEICYK